MRCDRCGLDTPIIGFCPFCNYSPLASAIYFSDVKAHLIFIFQDKELTFVFKRYPDEISERNLFERIAEEIHYRRVSKVFISAEKREDRDYCAEMLTRFALSFLMIIITDILPYEEFFEKVKHHVRSVELLERVEIDAEKKLSGAHSTIIGGREGMRLLLKLATSPYIKKIVPGVIENAGISGGGLRIKLTRCDERGNIRALLIDGASVQQIYIITTASNKKQGEEVLKELKSCINS